MKRILFTIIFISMAVTSFAQGIVRGIVKDEGGAPVPGVAVVLSGTSTGTETALDGSWQLSVTSGNASLDFICIGYDTVTEKVSGRTVIDVVLKESSTFLEETVVVGYGSMHKKDLTGSVGSIKSENLQNKVMLSVDEALSGSVAGLMVSSSSGKPNSQCWLQSCQ